MKTQADCWQATLEGKTLIKRNADNEVTLRNGFAIDQFGDEWNFSSPEVWEIKEKSKNNPQIQRAMELTNQTGMVEWVDVDKEKVSGIFSRIPTREEVVIPVEERLIVELYSK